MNRTRLEVRRHLNGPWDGLAVSATVATMLAVVLVLAGCTGSSDDRTDVGRSVVVDGANAPAAIDSSLGSTRPAPDPPWPAEGVSTTSSTVPQESTSASTSSALPLVTFTPMFIGLTSTIDEDLAKRMTPSWREGCPVALDDLRYLTLSYWSFDGQPVEGELVVHASVAADVVNVFQKMFAVEFPVQEMRLVDEYGADDNVSMAANNTSAFNCRFVAGTQSWSKHAYGLAIDINPLVNPYVQGARIDPPGGAEFVDRSIDFLGSINLGDDVVAAFADIGWSWGGAWNSPDYQHFSAP